MTLKSRPDPQVLQAIATAAAALVSILLSLYVANRSPVDVPARTRIEDNRQQILDLQTDVRWLRDHLTKPARPPRHPGRG